MKDFFFKCGDIVDYDGDKAEVTGFQHTVNQGNVTRSYTVRLLDREGISSMLNVPENSVDEWQEPIKVGDVIPSTVDSKFFHNLPVNTVLHFVLKHMGDWEDLVYLKVTDKKYVRSNERADMWGMPTVITAPDVLHNFVTRESTTAKIIYMP